MGEDDLVAMRRRQILEAATAVFARKGFKQARMDDIVAESGLSKGSLYWYFKSKDEIIIGIIDTLLGGELDRLASLRDADGSARERMLEFVELTIADLSRILRLIPMFYEFYALSLRSKTIQKIFQRYFRSYMEIMAPILQQGIDAGEFRPVDPEEAAIGLAALVEGTILLLAFDPERVDFERHMRTGADVFLRGLEARGANPAGEG